MRLYAVFAWHNGDPEIESVEVVWETPKLYTVGDRLAGFRYRIQIRKDENPPTSPEEAVDQYIERMLGNATKLRQRLKRVQLNIEGARKLREEL